MGPLDHQHLICEICCCSIPLEPAILYDTHLAWHRTLSNLPAQ